jgi:hypothetical protein
MSECRLTTSRRTASRRGCIGNAEGVHGPAVDLAALSESLLPLELCESVLGFRAHHTVNLTDIETFLIEFHLNLANLALAEAHRALALRSRRADRHDCDDPMVIVHDYDVVTHDEVLIAVPFRVDRDERLRNLDNPHLVRHDRADPQREIGIVDSRHIVAAEDVLTDLGSLFGRQVHGGLLALPLPGLALALVLAVLTLVLRIALLYLPLLSLASAPVLAVLALVLRVALLPLKCYERARLAREKAERAINEAFKADFLSSTAIGMCPSGN